MDVNCQANFCLSLVIPFQLTATRVTAPDSAFQLSFSGNCNNITSFAMCQNFVFFVITTLMFSCFIIVVVFLFFYFSQAQAESEGSGTQHSGTICGWIIYLSCHLIRSMNLLISSLVVERIYMKCDKYSRISKPDIIWARTHKTYLLHEVLKFFFFNFH